MFFDQWKQNFSNPGKNWGGSYVLQRMNREHRPLFKFAQQFFEIPANARVLDIGCGGGAHIAALLSRRPGAVVCGIDISPLSIKATLQLNKKAVQEGRVKAVQGQAEAIPFEDGTFDTVTASETVYFWTSLEKGFSEVFRVLKPGGTFAVYCDTADPIAAKKHTDVIKGMRVYTAEELYACCEGAGFTDITINMSEIGQICVASRKPGKIERILPELSGRSKMALIYLWSRAYESERPDPLFSDPAAAGIAEKLDYDFGPMAGSGLSQLSLAARTYIIDTLLNRFLEEHPSCEIINLGAALDTRFERIDNSRIQHWFDIDYESNLKLNEHLMPVTGKRSAIACDIADPSWCNRFKDDPAPKLIIAEGQFAYMKEGILRRLFNKIADAVPNAEMLYTLPAPAAITETNKSTYTKEGILADFPFPIWTMPDASCITSWNPYIEYIQEISLTKFAQKQWGWLGAMRSTPALSGPFACRIVKVRFNRH